MYLNWFSFLVLCLLFTKYTGLLVCFYCTSTSFASSVYTSSVCSGCWGSSGYEQSTKGGSSLSLETSLMKKVSAQVYNDTNRLCVITHSNSWLTLLASCRNKRWHVDEERAGQRAVPQQTICPFREGGDSEVFYQMWCKNFLWQGSCRYHTFFGANLKDKGIVSCRQPPCDL